MGLLATLISVPLTITYLGSERYGIWMTISSIISLLGFADLGLGNGLMNAISTANGRDDHALARRCVSSAFFLLAGVAGLLAVAFAFTYPLIPWHRVFNVSAEVGRDEAGPAMAVFFICFLLGLPLGIVNRIQTGYQKGFANAAWQAVGNVLTLVCLLVAIWLRASLPMLVLAMAGAPYLAILLNAFVLFRRQMPWLMPTWAALDWQAALQIGRIGLMFLILQLCAALQSSVDNLIVAQLFGPDAVTQLAVPARLFTLAGALIMIGLAPLWPAYGEAIARGDTRWVKRTVERSIIWAAFVSAAFAFPLIMLGKPIVKAWAGPNIEPSQSLLLALGCWMVLSTIGASIAMFLNAASIVALQTACAVLVGVTATAMKVWLGETYGNEGIVWVMNFAYAMFALLPLLSFVAFIIRQQGRPKFSAAA